MHDDRVHTERRIRRILDERLRPAVHGATAPLTLEFWQAPGEPVPVDEGLAAGYRPAAAGQVWGPVWATTWFHLTGTLPSGWAGREVEAVVDLGFSTTGPGFSAEGLVMRPDGSPVKALNPDSIWVPITAAATGGEPVDLYVEAASNPDLFGEGWGVPQGTGTLVGDIETADREPRYRVRRVELAVFEREIWNLVLDIEVLDQLMHELSTDEPRRWNILRALEAALDAIDLRDVAGTAGAARRALEPALAAPAVASAHRVSAVGHAHIDTAWLWPLRETVRKVARTAANVTQLMDDHPELVFAMSSAQQWAWMKEHRPAVWERMKEKVGTGQFVPVGGMWVESDTNLPGSEALARQFVHGKRFFLDEFGIETEEVWLPDSFGYTAALPQLVALSGSRWFLTQKMSWNQTDRFPHHTFWWEGLDGTRVLTHLPPVDTYNSDLSGKDLAHAVRNYAEKGMASRSLVPFGHGDGGGGPTREMVGRASRLANLEGSARVEIEPPADFFRKALEDHPAPSVWAGEMYLQAHRACYTTQHAMKAGNRRSEHLLREAELWAATATVRTGAGYPSERLDAIWKRVLTNQFHDILPGSAIAWVHRQARDTYAQIAAELEQIIGEAQRALAGNPASTDVVTFNAAPHARSGVPAGGGAILAASPDAPVVLSHNDIGTVLDNGLVRVVVDGRGLLTSVIDAATGREAVPPGEAANLLQLHQDLPYEWDAWEVDRHYTAQVTDITQVDSLTSGTRENGVAWIEIARTFGASRATQVLSLAPGARRVDVDTEVDWQECEKFLKAAFPLDVRAEVSTAEMQFGYVRRATTTNTTWEREQFEIPAHRYLHVGEPDYGIAVVNDSTYGHDVSRTVRGDGGTTTTVRLSLLRAPRFPDPHTDLGVHRLTYALVPGATLLDSTREGHWINLPARTVPGDRAVAPLVEIDEPGIVLSAVKLAEDDSGDLVVRVYESLGVRQRTALRVDASFGSWAVVDLLERPLDHPAASVRETGRTGEFTVSLRPFQILTLRLRRP
ncbi:alpha-mannosidase [Kineosporia sp. J2-2]|uniref:Alpha-mannosidase n=1 Tax=Kineosporia corallincola TaxID=2835133 RepID=A0ABS5TT68_9ACTN|nr:glycoside hydrolase family 38 C-terminal domain-containing protein [Kineosporia corallincola]MBT0773987.1 alpha-mannosidase [Kineosporia corallincola]